MGMQEQDVASIGSEFYTSDYLKPDTSTVKPPLYVRLRREMLP